MIYLYWAVGIIVYVICAGFIAGYVDRNINHNSHPDPGAAIFLSALFCPITILWLLIAVPAKHFGFMLADKHIEQRKTKLLLQEKANLELKAIEKELEQSMR